MTLTAEDRFVITELISMHGHLVDGGELDRLGELFTGDVVHDLTDFGQEPLAGVAAVRAAALAPGDLNPVGHHVTNVVLTRLDSGEVHALGIGVRADGTSGSVSYEDSVVRTDQGRRVSFRKVLARRAPLGRG